LIRELYKYGICLAEGRGVEIDVIEAAKYVKQAADQHYAAAQYEYGICLAKGQGVEIDLIGAARYFKQAADQHYAAARCDYGCCLANGRGVKIDLVEAAQYFKLAVDQSDSFALPTCLRSLRSLPGVWLRDCSQSSPRC
jgi:TPR repeat protein